MATDKTRVLNSRVPTDVCNAVKALAKLKGKTVSEWLVPVITNSVRFHLIKSKTKGNGD